MPDRSTPVGPSVSVRVRRNRRSFVIDSGVPLMSSAAATSAGLPPDAGNRVGSSRPAALGVEDDGGAIRIPDGVRIRRRTGRNRTTEKPRQLEHPDVVVLAAAWMQEQRHRFLVGTQLRRRNRSRARAAHVLQDLSLPIDPHQLSYLRGAGAIREHAVCRRPVQARSVHPLRDGHRVAKDLAGRRIEERTPADCSAESSAACPAARRNPLSTCEIRTGLRTCPATRCRCRWSPAGRATRRTRSACRPAERSGAGGSDRCRPCCR